MKRFHIPVHLGSTIFKLNYLISIFIQVVGFYYGISIIQSYMSCQETALPIINARTGLLSPLREPLLRDYRQEAH